MFQDRVDETSMNFDIDTKSDSDSDTETTFSIISNLEPYSFELKKPSRQSTLFQRCQRCINVLKTLKRRRVSTGKSNVSIEDSSKSEEEPTENLTQRITN